MPLNMLPYLLCADKLRPDRSRRKEAEAWSTEAEMKLRHMQYSVPWERRSGGEPTRFPLRSDASKNGRREEIKAKKQREMSGKVSNFTDLIQRVTASCLQPLSQGYPEPGHGSEDPKEGEEYSEGEAFQEFSEEEGAEDEKGFKLWEEEEKRSGVDERVREVEGMMAEVFESVSVMKKAYVSLQAAHCPWDPDKMRVADAAVVAQMRRLARLRERFRRGGAAFARGLVPVRDGIIGPYEAAVEDLKREVKAKEAEVENLKEKLKIVQVSAKKGRSHRRVSCSQVASLARCPTTELFESSMHQVKQGLTSFTALLLSLMRAARWDIAAAVRSIEGSGDAVADLWGGGGRHAKHALESYASQKIFQGFENETFYIDGSLSSLLHPEKFRADCFSQYRDMKAMDPVEILGILPTCHFGKFCCKKYLATIHPKMEESLFGNQEHRRVVLAGNHPRSEFYGVFLGLAKAVWLLHLLAFALDPAPSHFQANRGADFHPEYMESVVSYPTGRVPAGQVVGFPVTPGFKLGNGSVIKARVYLVPKP